MNIFKSLRELPNSVSSVICMYPIELMLCLYTFIVFALGKEEFIKEPYFLVLAPIFLVIAYAINNLTLYKSKRYWYYLCWLPLVPLSFLNIWKDWLDSSSGIITLVALMPLIILMSRRAVDNRNYIDDLFTYISSFILALGISGVVQALFSAIFYSTLYIFDIDTYSKIVESIWTYSFMATGILLAPFTFFVFLQNSFKSTFNSGILKKILLSYIFIPALICYTVILYIYFVKIIALWELPKGGIAYSVFGFVIVAVIAKAIQLFYDKQWYSKLLDRFSYISIPAVIMFWIGVSRRIGEYGLTEWRAAMIVCGVIMTAYLILFATKRISRYFYVSALAIILFSINAYVPGLSFEELSIKSQERIVNRLATELEIKEPDGQFTTNILPNDTTKLEAYRQIYGSLKYLSRVDTLLVKPYGYDRACDFLTIIPKDMSHYVEWGWADDYSYQHIKINRTIEIDNLSDYSRIIVPVMTRLNDSSKTHYHYEDNKLYIYENNIAIFTMNGNELLSTQLKKVGYDINNIPTEKTLDSLSDDFLCYKNDSLLLVLSQMSIYNVPDSVTVDNIDIHFVMLK